MATGVSATGLKSFRVGVSDLLGTGMMMEDLYIRGTTAWDSERLKMSVYTPASCYPQAFSTLGCTPSGPAALCGFTFFRAFRTCVCVCHLKDCVRGVTGSFWWWLMVQPVEPSIEGVKAVWESGISGVCGCRGSPVVCYRLDSLPHTPVFWGWGSSLQVFGSEPFWLLWWTSAARIGISCIPHDLLTWRPPASSCFSALCLH